MLEKVNERLRYLCYILCHTLLAHPTCCVVLLSQTACVHLQANWMCHEHIVSLSTGWLRDPFRANLTGRLIETNGFRKNSSLALSVVLSRQEAWLNGERTHGTGTGTFCAHVSWKNKNSRESEKKIGPLTLGELDWLEVYIGTCVHTHTYRFKMFGGFKWVFCQLTFWCLAQLWSLCVYF